MVSKAYSIATDFKALIMTFITSSLITQKLKLYLALVHAKTHKRTNHSLCVNMNFQLKYHKIWIH